MPFDFLNDKVATHSTLITKINGCFKITLVRKINFMGNCNVSLRCIIGRKEKITKSTTRANNEYFMKKNHNFERLPKTNVENQNKPQTLQK